MSPHLLSVARWLHRAAWLRRLARRLASGLPIRQPFHDGVIYMDAVDHSWSWIGGRRLDTFDRDLQDALLARVQTRGRLIDVGCNVGIMSLATLLRDPDAQAVCVDPNSRALSLLARSLRRNGCAERATLIHAAISGGETALHYDATGSFTGHLSAAGIPVTGLPLAELLTDHAREPVVLKIDVEGYELELVDTLVRTPVPAGSVALVELHPAGFNRLGDPRRFVATLSRAAGLTLRLLDGRAAETLDPAAFNQLEVIWS